MKRYAAKDSYLGSFNVLFNDCESHLGKFESIDAAGQAALTYAKVNDAIGVNLSFEFDGFAKGIKGICIAGKHGFIAFIGGTEVVVSKYYDSGELRSKMVDLKDSMNKDFINRSSMLFWLDVLDTSVIDPDKAVELHMSLRKRKELNTLLKAA